MSRLVTLNPTVHCIGVANSLGAPFPGAEAGPQRLLESGVCESIRHHGLAAVWPLTLQPKAIPDALHALLLALAEQTALAVSGGKHVLVVGGDHSGAAAVWRGVGRALGEAPGLIWFDAHLDAHIPDSSPSGNRHGMPLAALLGEGEAELVDIPGPALNPARLVVIGVRNYEPAEHELLTRHGVRIYMMDEVRRRGLPEVFAEARTLVADGPWGISLDVDVIDPLAAPGVSTPASGGLREDELVQALRGVFRNRQFVGLEIAEFNPLHDAGSKTAELLLSLIEASVAPDAATLMRWEAGFGANNYAPLPVVLTRGKGAWLWDVQGRRYLDFMSAYSATSFGHAHPALLACLTHQAKQLAVTSRAYGNDRLPLLLRRLSLVFGYERVLPVNTGLEAVETALKAARKWAYKIKGVPENQAEIIACDGNFHGRSIAITGLSSDAQYRDGFGPYPAGLKRVPYGDASALAAAITENTAAFLVEPIQGEGGIILPPAGYLKECASICRTHNVLLLADEVQTGLGRTGKLLACQHDGVRPDGLILGKALGGGLLPVSAFLADQHVMQVFSPGDHGSTFGGNPLACAVALRVLDLLEEGGLIEHAEKMGELMLIELLKLAEKSPVVSAVRGKGLFAGIELNPALADARHVAERLLSNGILTKDTHHTVLRLAPPLIIQREDLLWGLERIAQVLNKSFGRRPVAA